MRATGRRGSVRTPGWLDRTLVAYFVLAGVAVFGFWARSFLDGTATTSLFQPAEESEALLGRTIGAVGAGLLLAMAAARGRSGRTWAWRLASLGAGMVGYAALNTLGETLPTGSAGSGSLIAALIGAVILGRCSAGKPAFVVLSVGLIGCTAWLVGRGIRMGDGSLMGVATVIAWPGLHYVAEATMAVVTIWGLFAWRRSRGWGIHTALFGLGTYCYSTLNALDWAYVNDRTLLPMLAVTLAVAAAGAVRVIGAR